MSQGPEVLVVDDEIDLAEVVAGYLQAEGFSAALAHTGPDAVEAARTGQPRLVVLDVMLPGFDGIEVCRRIRTFSDCYIIMLTARDDEVDKVLGLSIGADDYLVKPFAFDELLARIRALLRRGRPEETLRLKAADVEMDLVTRSVRRAGMALELTTREFELLEFLLRHQGSLVSREMIARDVWKTAQRATPLDNVIDVHIGRLRRKLDDGHTQKLIHTLRGVGFTLREDAPT